MVPAFTYYDIVRREIDRVGLVQWVAQFNLETSPSEAV